MTEVEDHVRVEPKLFGLATDEAVEKQLRETYSGYFSKDMGKVVAVISVSDVGEGVIIPGDGAAYYKCTFKLLVWKPEMQELVFGVVREITDFGSFINLGGVMRGMVHISQTMEDYVSFSKSNTLSGKKSNKSLNEGDECLARIIAISYKEKHPKIGLTMRQPGLGKLKWVEQEKKKKKEMAKKMEKEDKE